MSITAECTSCGRRYQAPDTMAGKRVRCKQCGNIFEVPRADDGAGGDVSALAELEKSFHSLDATAAGTAVGSGGADDDSAGMSAPPPRGTRANTRFDYPFSREVDNWAPKIFTLGALALLAYQCYSLNNKPTPWPGADSAPWLGAAWFACAFLGYAMFVGPMTHAMVRRAGGRLGYEMPSGEKRRGFASGLVGYVLAYMMWSVGGGALIALILGIFCGLILTTGSVWLLFRLKPAEVAPTAGYTALGFVLGSVIVSVILFGLNVLGQNVMTKTGWVNPDQIPASPIGAGFDWINQDQRDAIVAMRTAKANRPAPPAPAPTGPTAAPGPTTPGGPAPSPANPSQPQPLANSSPLVKLMERPPTGEGFEDALRPLVDSQNIGVLRRAAGSYNIAIWSTETWKRAGTIEKIAENAANERFVVSPDGVHVARLTSFPRLGAQIWEASAAGTGRVGVTPLDASLGEPYLVGFTSDRNLLVRWQVRGANACTLEVVDTATNKSLQRITTAAFDRVGFNLAVSHDGAMAAIATKAEKVPSLLLYDLRTGQKLSSTPIDSLDPNQAVMPTGMAFSLDNHQIALLFEQAGIGLLVCFQVDATKPVLSKVGDYYPNGMIHDQLFTGSAVAWLPEGNGWVLYGQSVISSTGQPLDNLGGLHVYNFTSRNPDIVEIVGKVAGTNQKMITVLHLDLPKIAAMAH